MAIKNLSIKKAVVFLFLFLFLGCAFTRPFGVPSLSSRQEYAQANLGLSRNVKKAILDGRVIEGMTKEQVRAAWGRPSNSDDFSVSSNAWWYEKDGEGWWYKNFFGSTHFVKFNSGRVTSASSYFK